VSENERQVQVAERNLREIQQALEAAQAELTARMQELRRSQKMHGQLDRKLNSYLDKLIDAEDPERTTEEDRSRELCPSWQHGGHN